MRRDRCGRRIAYGVGTEKRRRTQGAAIRASRRAGGFAPVCGGPDCRRGRQTEKIIRQAPIDDDDDAPRERKPAASRSGSKRRSKSRGKFGIGRLVYWGAVLGLWGAIAVIGVVVWVGAHLPPIQALEIPKRPPTIQIVGLDGSVLATRGEMAGANVSLKDLPPYLPKAFIAIEDRRFYSHYGVDPLGIARAAVTNILHRGVSQGGSTLTQQLAKNLFLTQERTLQRKLQEVELALWLERKHSKSEILELYLEPGLFRFRRLWRRGRRATLFRQIRQERHAGGGRDARRPGQIAVAAGAEPQSGRRREARPDRADRDGGCQIHHRSAGAGLDRASLLQCEAGGRRHRQLCGGLDRRSARRPDRPDRSEHRGRNLDRPETAERSPKPP